MARRTFRQIISEIQRMPGMDKVSFGEILNVVNTVQKDLLNQPWPFNYAETNVLVPPTYSTGTVSITDGTAAVTGTLTVWDTGWTGRRLQFNSVSNVDYVVSSINSPTSLTLNQNVNLGQNLTNVNYKLYQDTFDYPADYLLGSDVALLHPTVRYRITKIPRYKFEMYMNAGMRSFFTNVQRFYCDHGQNVTTGRYRFRIGPPPGTTAEYRLCYHSIASDVSLAATTFLPEGFDEVITLASASKLYDLKKMPGESASVKAIADAKIRLLKRQIATQTIDDVPEASFEIPDSSISQWGLSIERMT